MELASAASAAIPFGYAEFAPPADLRWSVACFWTRRRDPRETGEAPVHRVLPDGCVDILLAVDECDRDAATPVRGTGVGPMSRPLIVQGPGPRLYLGVRFKPGYALAALGIPGQSLLDADVGYEVLSPNAASEIDEIASGQSDDERLRRFVDVIRRRMARAPAVPPAVRRAVGRIVQTHGDLRVSALAAEIGVTRQQMARLFAAHVGVSPKLLARIMRTQAVVTRLAHARGDRAVDWSALAYELGYYDQPHFIDDFKTLTGLTPGEWWRG